MHFRGKQNFPVANCQNSKSIKISERITGMVRERVTRNLKLLIKAGTEVTDPFLSKWKIQPYSMFSVSVVYHINICFPSRDHVFCSGDHSR